VFAAFGPNVAPWEFDGKSDGTFFYLSRYDLATPRE